MKVVGKALDGKTITEAGLRGVTGLFLYEVHRANGDVLRAVGPDALLREGDLLYFAGARAAQRLDGAPAGRPRAGAAVPQARSPRASNSRAASLRDSRRPRPPSPRPPTSPPRRPRERELPHEVCGPGAPAEAPDPQAAHPPGRPRAGAGRGVPPLAPRPPGEVCCVHSEGVGSASVVVTQCGAGLGAARAHPHRPAPTLTGPRRAARPPGPACPQTAREARFLQTYGAAVLSVHRSGESVTGDVADIKLQAGDVLVLETGPEFAKVFSHSPAFALISKVRRRRCCPGGARGRAHAHWPLLRARCKGGCTHRPWDPRVWLWREHLEGRGARRSQTRPLAWPGP
jgi:hypothetical protein